MGDFLQPPCKHNIEHLPCTIDVPLSLGRAGKGSFSLASRPQEDFTSSNLDVYGMSSLYLQLSEHHRSMVFMWNLGLVLFVYNDLLYSTLLDMLLKKCNGV